MSTDILKNKGGIFTGHIVKSALWEALKKFHPVTQMKNPVIFIVTLGALFCTGIIIRDWMADKVSNFIVQITLWLYFTTFFANFAEAIAEGRGKARADALRNTKTNVTARAIIDGKPGFSLVPDAGNWLENQSIPLGPEILDEPKVAALVARYKAEVGAKPQ